jgi:hypothetical protein
MFGISNDPTRARAATTQLACVERCLVSAVLPTNPIHGCITTFFQKYFAPFRSEKLL